MNDSFITIIPLATSFLHAPYISDQLIALIHREKKAGKKTLIFYSRRGNSRAWMCQDCGFFERCPNCDIALAYHTDPTKRLICHQCNLVASYPVVCPNCKGTHFSPIGVGIQRIESELGRILGSDYSINRIDSDTYKKPLQILERVSQSDVIIATSMANLLQVPDIGAVVFLCFEVNLSIPEYDLEEKLFTEVSYFKKQRISLYIQTYTPDHPLLDTILFGNYHSFLAYLTAERKAFQYPPYTEFATIRIHDIRQERVRDIISHLTNKILLLKEPSTFLAFDKDIWEKYAGEWVQKIILKDIDLSYIIHQLEIEIVRNRAVTLEWN